MLLLLLCDLLIPAIMLLAGWWMEKHPPQKINGWFGYRTGRSMKNQQTWLFAHRYAGRLWQKWGLPLLILSAVVHIPFWEAEPETQGILSILLTLIQCAILIGSILPVERALERTFDEEGRTLGDGQLKMDD